MQVCKEWQIKHKIGTYAEDKTMSTYCKDLTFKGKQILNPLIMV